MDLFILDEKFKKETLIDSFESLIWTDRYRPPGDFELVVHANTRHRTRLVPDKWLQTNVSTRLMRIGTVEEHVDANGEKMLRATGYSMEKVLEERVLVDPNNPTWDKTGTPDYLARVAILDFVTNGLFTKDDILPTLAPKPIPPNSIPAPGEELTVNVEPTILLNFIKDVCNSYDLGYRIELLPNGTLGFTVYTGRDRTSATSTNNVVIFSPGFGNVLSLTKVASRENYRNIAIVTSVQGNRIVEEMNTSPYIKGFNRRVLHVPATEVTVDWPSIRVQPYLLRLGKAALAEHRRILAFDGEITQYDNYIYGKDYEVGDVIEMRDDSGDVNYMRVAEQINVSDAQGERSYPTLELKQGITPGSWLSQDGNEAWSDMTWLRWIDADLLSGAGNAPNLSPDPNFEDLSKWRATGNFALAYIDGHRGLKVWENSSQGALYVDSTAFFPCVPGDIVYASVEIKVTVPNTIRMQITGQSGASVVDDPPARVAQVPADGWVKHYVICRMGGTAGTFRAIVWPGGMDLPIGEGFYIRRYQVSKL